MNQISRGMCVLDAEQVKLECQHSRSTYSYSKHAPQNANSPSVHVAGCSQAMTKYRPINFKARGTITIGTAWSEISNTLQHLD